MFDNRSGRNEHSLEDRAYMLPTKFRFNWPSGFRGEDFLEINQSETRIVCGGQVLITNRDEISNLYRGTSIDASYQFSVHLGNQFQRRRLIEIDQSKTRIACGGHVFNGSKLNEQSLQRTFHRCFLPSFGSFGQTVSEEKNLKKSANKKQESPVVPCC